MIESQYIPNNVPDTICSENFRSYKSFIRKFSSRLVINYLEFTKPVRRTRDLKL